MKRHQVFNLLITSSVVLIGCRHTDNLYKISTDKPVLDNDNYIGFIDESLDKMTFVMKKEEGVPPSNRMTYLKIIAEDIKVDLFDSNLKESLLNSTEWLKRE